MRRSLPRAAVAVALLTCASAAGELRNLGLDETILGVPDPPFLIGDALSDGQLSALPCNESPGGDLVCPVRRDEDRMFGVMIERSGSLNRVTAVLVYWTCDAGRCDDALRQTVAAFAERIGEQPELLDGSPIWKDREASRRDLLVNRLGETMICVTLLRSDP